MAFVWEQKNLNLSNLMSETVDVRCWCQRLCQSRLVATPVTRNKVHATIKYKISRKETKDDLVSSPVTVIYSAMSPKRYKKKNNTLYWKRYCRKYTAVLNTSCRFLLEGVDCNADDGVQWSRKVGAWTPVNWGLRLTSKSDSPTSFFRQLVFS